MLHFHVIKSSLGYEFLCFYGITLGGDLWSLYIVYFIEIIPFIYMYHMKNLHALIAVKLIFEGKSKKQDVRASGFGYVLSPDSGFVVVLQ